MTPQARLHPSAPTSISRTSARPAVATLSEPVKVSTMIRPKSTSVTRSMGSSTRFETLISTSQSLRPARSVAVGDVRHSVDEGLRPAEGLLDGLARIGESGHEAEREVRVDLPVQVPVRLEGDVLVHDLRAEAFRLVGQELVKDEPGPHRLARRHLQ